MIPKTFVTLFVLLGVNAAAYAAPSNNVTIGKVDKPGWQPRFLGQVHLTHAAFLELYYTGDDALEYPDRWNIYISSFDPLGGLDEVYRMRSPGRYLDDISAWNIEVMDISAYWPNNPDYLPSTIGGTEGVIWTSGFLVPGKKDGQLQMYGTASEPMTGPFNIASNDDDQYSYHRCLWKDIDLDGDLDALTARFNIPLIGPPVTQLVWFENEGNGFSEGWPQHVIADGPDVHFGMVTLSAGGRDYDCLVVGEFWNQRTSIFWTESEANDWSDPSLISSRVINENAGQVFDVLVADINQDGVLEFLATEYKTDIGVGQVTVYQFPEDFRVDEFPSFTIAEGFVPNPIFGGQSMSPGTPKLFYPTTEYAVDIDPTDGKPHKPYILLSGDDDGRMYILYPESEDRTNWVYQKHILTDTQDTTVGKMAHGDIDGDGYEEIIVAGYSIGEIYVYSYAP